MISLVSRTFACMNDVPSHTYNRVNRYLSNLLLSLSKNSLIVEQMESLHLAALVLLVLLIPLSYPLGVLIAKYCCFKDKSEMHAVVCLFLIIVYWCRTITV